MAEKKKKVRQVNNFIGEEWINKIHCGDSLDLIKRLPDNSVDTVITSPPYYGLRDYGTGTWMGGDPNCKHKPGDTPTKRGVKSSTLGGSKNVGHQHEGYKSVCGKCGALRVDKQIGLERSLNQYIKRLTVIFKEVLRVLKPTGICWINIGDSYNGYPGNAGQPQTLDKNRKEKYVRRPTGYGLTVKKLKNKDLMGVPWMLAFALRDIGFYLRQDIIWDKKNCLPESVTDRFTKSHEYIFMMTKSDRYFFDQESVKEPAIYADSGYEYKGKGEFNGKTRDFIGREAFRAITEKRNKRDVWRVPTKSFPEAHFAVFPDDLIEPCVKSATSEKGVCCTCAKPWERIVEKMDDVGNDGETESMYSEKFSAGRLAKKRQAAREKGYEYVAMTRTVGWQPTCKCKENTPVPAVVLDIFMGAATTAVVSKRLNRNFIGFELNPDYIKLSENRMQKEFGLFHESIK